MLRNADGGGGVKFSGKKALRRYEGVGGVQFPEEKNVT